MIKPIEQEKVYHVLKNICRIAGKSNLSFEFQNQNDRYRIAYNDILYFQSEGRRINIILKKEIKTFYGKLSEIEEKCRNSFGRSTSLI